MKQPLVYGLAALLLLAACRNEPKTPVAEKTVSSKPVAPTVQTSEMPEPLFVQEGVLEFRAPKQDKASLRLEIEIAHEGRERAQGLMWRKKMEERQAMLFVFEYPEPQSFWMRNTYIPLDIIYVDEKFEVVTVLKNVPVLNDAPRPSNQPAQYVIEVNAGVADKYNIVPGSQVSWSDFVTGQPLGAYPVQIFQ